MIVVAVAVLRVDNDKKDKFALCIVTLAVVLSQFSELIIAKRLVVIVLDICPLYSRCSCGAGCPILRVDNDMRG